MQHDEKPLDSKSAVTDITEPRREDRLRTEFDLVRERRPVYVLDTNEAKKRTGNAERVAKFREKQAQAGLVPTAVPAELLAAVKTAGGWEAWAKAQKAAVAAPAKEVPAAPVKEVLVAPAVEVKRPKQPETVAPVVQKPSPEESKTREIGRKVQTLKGWRRRIVFMMLGI
jgi:hypothetical protein